MEASRAGLGDRPTDCTEGVPEARNGLRDTFLIKKMNKWSIIFGDTCKMSLNFHFEVILFVYEM